MPYMAQSDTDVVIHAVARIHAGILALVGAVLGGAIGWTIGAVYNGVVALRR